MSKGPSGSRKDLVGTARLERRSSALAGFEVELGASQRLDRYRGTALSIVRALLLVALIRLVVDSCAARACACALLSGCCCCCSVCMEVLND